MISVFQVAIKVKGSDNTAYKGGFRGEEREGERDGERERERGEREERERKRETNQPQMIRIGSGQ